MTKYMATKISELTQLLNQLAYMLRGCLSELWLKIKPKQKIKVCYLISKLYDIVPEKHKVAWREDILLHFGIDSSYYESKYSHPRGSDASRSSMAFADDVDEIIKNHKKRA